MTGSITLYCEGCRTRIRFFGEPMHFLPEPLQQLETHLKHGDVRVEGWVSDTREKAEERHNLEHERIWGEAIDYGRDVHCNRCGGQTQTLHFVYLDSPPFPELGVCEACYAELRAQPRQEVDLSLKRGHHIWCNFWGRPLPCKFCAKAWIKYPYETEEEMRNLAAKYFPDAIPLGKLKE